MKSTSSTYILLFALVLFAVAEAVSAGTSVASPDCAAMEELAPRWLTGGSCGASILF
jgi:hypothetical protein